MSSSCPFCGIILPFHELERHANNHIMEDDLVKDMELAEQIAVAPPSPRFPDIPLGSKITTEAFVEWFPESSTSGAQYHSTDHTVSSYQDDLLSLVTSQTKSAFHKVEDGLMYLLKKCLEKETKTSVSVIAGYVDHFQSYASEDSGWGCGWRNIQMLSSHLLVQRKEAREVIYGGSGFVPDIPSLQRWLEIAWARGFDIPGSEFFNHKIYASRKWIGTTECAVLIRSFGLLARVVDFDSKSESGSHSGPSSSPDSHNCELNNVRRRLNGKKEVESTYGPMDKFLSTKRYKETQCCPSQENAQGNDKRRPCTDNNSSSGQSKGYEALASWVWNYFSSEVCGESDDSGHVRVSRKTPLYFQHDGHSRTIIGIQMQGGSNERAPRYTLLIFDPSQRTSMLEKSLKANSGWQKMIKRGIHTLRKPQYQVCYVDPGIAQGKELEQVKTIDSILIKI